ncbi:riboflavin biosynthesis protein RibF [Salisediminibacterium selenitireducens]|uniref:Riboflavin biosynthesis protein n=1 Tax=Bacillus selenitireducens (strain ATCC 700615 / DSM 15326 / MLS10) TaxID=439292 RepID=D6XU13_BACIE|nr:riboflavin biosynthesis protein RibF [Salisediminibacterium selenitireducens]ADH99299.1 riboflavin biosynthesis protein RibF [[Bacillus] selenitireducens MLS10]
MEIIRMKHPQRGLNLPQLAVALGFFDGVHKGHQKVIEMAKEKAGELGVKSGVMTFYPHPKEVLRPETAKEVKYLSAIEDKAELIGFSGVDYLIIVEFDPRFADLSPQQFVDQYLIGQNIVHVVAGFDYTYGRMGKGTMETLPFHSRGMLTQTIVKKVASTKEKISSTSIRTALVKGDIRKVNDYLGRLYTLSGNVEHGEKRGRTIGFPTANVSVDDKTLTPAPGVYAVTANVEGDSFEYTGICNIGFKPTFHDEKPDAPVLEIHLFDFSKTIYDTHITVYFHDFVRGEVKFSGVDELVDQIKKDVDQVKTFFSDRVT